MKRAVKPQPLWFLWDFKLNKRGMLYVVLVVFAALRLISVTWHRVAADIFGLKLMLVIIMHHDGHM